MIYFTYINFKDKLKSLIKPSFSAMVIIGLLYSCITYKNVDFQAMRPAQIKLGTNFERVDIHCEFCSDPQSVYRMDTLNQSYTIVSLYFLQSLKENLEKSPVFQETKFDLVSSDSLLSMLKDFKTRNQENGLVILLDSIFINDTLITHKERYQSPFYLYGIIHKIGCRTYYKKTMQILDNHLLEDTLFWPPQPTIWMLDANIPTAEEARIETGIKAGEAYAHYLAPYWTEQSRYFYYGNRYFNQAYNFIQKSELDSAVNVLQQQQNEKLSRNMAMMNFHNLAIAYELKDDMIKAFTMADSSYKIKKTELTKSYIEKLRIRKLDKAALDWQLN